jgi:hypothetical protein
MTPPCAGAIQPECTTEEEAMLKIETDKATGFAELTMDGGIDDAEYKAVIGAIDELLKTHDELNVVAVVRDLGWVDMGVWPKDLVFHLTHRHWLNHFAVVSDIGWFGSLMRFFVPLYPAAEFQTFTLAQLDEARRWAKVGNVSRAAA